MRLVENVVDVGQSEVMRDAGYEMRGFNKRLCVPRIAYLASRV
jgi:hypothetical protein